MHIGGGFDGGNHVLQAVHRQNKPMATMVVQYRSRLTVRTSPGCVGLMVNSSSANLGGC